MKKYISVEKNLNGTYNVNTNVTPSDNVETNKEVTISVSAYTSPVEITPTEGKDSMAKATVTLTNIPSGNNTLYYWLNEKYFVGIYTNFNVAPVSSSDAKFLYVDWNSSAEDLNALEVRPCGSYTRISDTEMICSNDRWYEPLTFERKSQGDVSLWTLSQ